MFSETHNNGSVHNEPVFFERNQKFKRSNANVKERTEGILYIINFNTPIY